MNWEFIGQATILTILIIVVLVFLWSAYETSQQKKHERELALVEAQRPKPVEVQPGAIQITGNKQGEPDYGVRVDRPEGYDRTGDRGL